MFVTFVFCLRIKKNTYSEPMLSHLEHWQSGFGNLENCIWIRVIQSNVALKNRHKSKTDYLILDSKKWDFKIQIILIQIKCFEQLAHGEKSVALSSFYLCVTILNT